MATNPNMVAIQTVTVPSGGAASIEFTSIPQTYTDLVIKFSTRSTRSAVDDSVFLRANSDTGSNYSWRFLRGNGSTANSSTNTSTRLYVGAPPAANATASTFGNGLIYIPNYAGSTYKSLSIDTVGENNATEAYAFLAAGLWSSTSAITTITLLCEIGNFVEHSSATLYGVTSAGYGAKATGGIITQDANYFYHTFAASGTFTPTSNITADYLVVAGGGGGGGGVGAAGTGGGGGAGGYLSGAGISLTSSTNYTVTIGAGGAAGTGPFGNNTDGGNGSNSVFSSYTANGGGGGGGGLRNAPTGTFGSGGGGGNDNGTGASGTSGQGFAGGSGATYNNPGVPYTTIRAAGGGGGSAAAGENKTSTDTVGGNGGTGTNWQSLGTFYAGGGGGGGTTGGTGGSGVGGAGAARDNIGNSALSNTGSGGGGGASTATDKNGGAGGSGIVIVRYAK